MKYDTTLRNIIVSPVVIVGRGLLMVPLMLLIILGRWCEVAYDWLDDRLPGWHRGGA